LTLNVLLSFAQFEREVTGERIRDKIAASKKKGIWMGGVVPLGYRVEARALHIVEDHAAIVRSLFGRYLEAGSVVRLKQQLDADGVRIPIRIDGGGGSTGGGLLSRGHVYKLLSNPIYVGRIVHSGQVHEGQHPPIVPQELWEQVQRGLRDHLGTARTNRTRQSSDALLAGKLQLSEVPEETDSARVLTLPWTRPSPYRKREIIQGANDAKTYARPMPANARAILIEAFGDAHRWLTELLSDPRQTLESLPSREGKTDRSIRMTLSLAFLAPEIVKAAVEGRLPRGFGLKRLVGLPMPWPDQWRTLGLQASAQA
jgi:hypothetical protein